MLSHLRRVARFWFWWQQGNRMNAYFIQSKRHAPSSKASVAKIQYDGWIASA